MESGETCGSVIGRTKKVDKTRRTLSEREEDVLITTLKDMISKGRKSENGFKAGYLTLLESAMHAVIPGCTLRGNPHINSKVHVWKKTYNGLYLPNHATQAVDSLPRLVQDIRKRSCNWRALQSFENSLQDVLKLNDDVPNDLQFGVAFTGDTEHGDDDSISETTTPSSKPKVATTSKKRKRKQNNEVDDAIVTAINNLADITKVTMNDLVKHLSGPDNLADVQDVVLDALQGMSELSEDKQVIAAQLLFNNHNNMALFKRLNDKGKLCLVRRLLRGD
ncbi:hypothetical protein F511_17364 [Dorcoceras hygrometricum]|uniref:Myb/SANT-like domain-containing protein n=1 Tax=Dorcoceras hygrometricum TaxID=472368 RepID=A0A2Z7ANN3_9LAMI|nr:hypothetical protein F511_17364 [Dorcoceras hygrometricum]